MNHRSRHIHRMTTALREAHIRRQMEDDDQAARDRGADVDLWLKRGGQHAFDTIYDQADPIVKRWLLETFDDYVWSDKKRGVM